MLPISFDDHFSDLTDPRVERTRLHSLRTIVTIALCGVLCGAESWVEIEAFAKAVRGHWGIENELHWLLDVAFREDESRVRAKHAAQNFAVLRRLALQLLRQDRSVKIGIKGKRLKAGWDEDYLLKILSQ